MNLIVGENWVGKTTIFEAIRLLLDERISVKNYFDDIDFFNPWEGIFIEVLLSFAKDDKNLFHFRDCITEISDTEVIVLLWLYKEKKDAEEIYYGKKSFLTEWFWPTIQDFKISIYEIQKRYLRVLYIDGTRAHNNFYENQGFFYRLIKEVYNDHRDKISVTKDDIKTVSQIIKILWLEGIDNFPDFLNELNLEQDQKKIVWLDDDQHLSFRSFFHLMKLKLDEKFLDENSVGWQYLFFTAFAIFYIKELKKITQDGDQECYIILMEEPEAHLHPQSQRNLLNFLKKKFEGENDTSIFVSTHSPNVIRAVKDIGKIHFIRKNSAKSLPEKIDGDLLNFQQKLSIFIDVNKAELLFARWIIFVEWIAEEILLPKLFQIHTWKSLDNYGISIINVNSTDFYCYALYAKKLEIPFVIITDGDITKEEPYTWKNRKNLHSDIFSDTNYFIGFDTFEIDLIFSGNKNLLLNAFVATGETINGTRYVRFWSEIDELLTFNKANSDNENYRTNFWDKRDSILRKYIQKSELSYALLNESVITQLIIPEYITNAFDAIKTIFMANWVVQPVAQQSSRARYRVEEEINIEDIPF